ncbi:hypothetical protein GOGPGP_GOGPGP_13485, partial [Dysosmobacter welbionis]
TAHCPRRGDGKSQSGAPAARLPHRPVPLLRGPGQQPAGGREPGDPGPGGPGGGAPAAGQLLRREAVPRVQQDRSVGPHVPAHLPPGSP